MNFLLNLRVLIKTLNELLLIHLIGPDYVKYEYFGKFGSDMERDTYLISNLNKSYYRDRYKMIDGDDDFNFLQKERIEYCISNVLNARTNPWSGGGIVIGRSNTASGGYSTITGGYSNGSVGISTSSPSTLIDPLSPCISIHLACAGCMDVEPWITPRAPDLNLITATALSSPSSLSWVIVPVFP